MDAKQARDILERALQPKQSEVDRQLKIVEKKIRIAASLKMNRTEFEVITEFKQPRENDGIAKIVAHTLKSRDFNVKIKANVLKISW